VQGAGKITFDPVGNRQARGLPLSLATLSALYIAHPRAGGLRRADGRLRCWCSLPAILASGSGIGAPTAAGGPDTRVGMLDGEPARCTLSPEASMLVGLSFFDFQAPAPHWLSGKDRLWMTIRRVRACAGRADGAEPSFIRDRIRQAKVKGGAPAMPLDGTSMDCLALGRAAEDGRAIAPVRRVARLSCQRAERACR
jgi:hypothetical protein